MPFCADECWLRNPIFFGVLGVAIWAILSSFILWSNWRSTRSKRTLAVLFIFLGLAADYLWQTVLTYERSGWFTPVDPVHITILLVIKNIIWSYMWIVITLFMLLIYRDKIRIWLRWWLDD